MTAHISIDTSVCVVLGRAAKIRMCVLFGLWFFWLRKRSLIALENTFDCSKLVQLD